MAAAKGIKEAGEERPPSPSSLTSNPALERRVTRNISSPIIWHGDLMILIVISCQGPSTIVGCLFAILPRIRDLVDRARYDARNHRRDSKKCQCGCVGSPGRKGIVEGERKEGEQDGT